MTWRESKADHIRQIMGAEGETVGKNTRGFNRGRYEAVANLDDYEGLKDEARAIKEDTIEWLPELIEELEATVEANGGTVYLADDAVDANQYIREGCADAEASRPIKSKLMTSEEIKVSEPLESDGIDVVETDLDGWALQVTNEAPSHIIVPAIHKSRKAIARLFNKQFDPDKPLKTAEELTEFTRHKLRDRIRAADLGMIGTNFITADICLRSDFAKAFTSILL